MAKMKKKAFKEDKKEPKRSDNFKGITIGEYAISFNADTNRFVVRKNGEFLFSDQNLDHAIRYAGG